MQSFLYIENKVLIGGKLKLLEDYMGGKLCLQWD